MYDLLTEAEEITLAERALMQAMDVRYPTNEIIEIARDMVIARRYLSKRLALHRDN